MQMRQIEQHKSFYTRLGLFLAVGLCLSLIIVSCSSRNKSNESSNAPKSITIWTSEEINTDPLLAKNAQQFFLSSLTSSTLLELDGNKGIKNGLAEDYSVSSDGLTVTVDLDGSKFSNGDRITAKDVKATFSRLARESEDYLQLIKNIKGVGEAKGGLDFFGITALKGDKEDDQKDDRVEFSLINPDPYFLFRLAHPALGIVNAKSITAENTLDTKIFSGRYTVDKAQNEVGKTTTYKSRSKSLPTIKVVKKAADDIASGKNIKADLVLGSTKDSSFNTVSVPQLALASWNIYVSDSSSPLADIRFREAILLSLNKDSLIKPYDGRAVVPTHFGLNVYDAIKCANDCESDVKQAKKLLAEIYPSGGVPTINIDIESNEIQKSLAASAVKELAEVGIPAVIKEHSAEDLSNAIARGDIQLFRLGFVSNVAVMGDEVVKGYKADSTENISGLADETLEKNIESFLTAKSLKGRKEASKNMQERLRDLWLIRPIASFQSVVSVDKSISNVEVDFYGRIDLEKLKYDH